jgi:hypothetical protein
MLRRGARAVCHGEATALREVGFRRPPGRRRAEPRHPARVRPSTDTHREDRRMNSVFWLIGVIVVALAAINLVAGI